MSESNRMVTINNYFPAYQIVSGIRANIENCNLESATSEERFEFIKKIIDNIGVCDFTWDNDEFMAFLYHVERFFKNELYIISETVNNKFGVKTGEAQFPSLINPVFPFGGYFKSYPSEYSASTVSEQTTYTTPFNTTGRKTEGDIYDKYQFGSNKIYIDKKTGDVKDFYMCNEFTKFYKYKHGRIIPYSLQEFEESYLEYCDLRKNHIPVEKAFGQYTEPHKIKSGSEIPIPVTSKDANPKYCTDLETLKVMYKSLLGDMKKHNSRNVYDEASSYYPAFYEFAVMKHTRGPISVEEYTQLRDEWLTVHTKDTECFFRPESLIMIDNELEINNNRLLDRDAFQEAFITSILESEARALSSDSITKDISVSY